LSIEEFHQLAGDEDVADPPSACRKLLGRITAGMCYESTLVFDFFYGRRERDRFRGNVGCSRKSRAQYRWAHCCGARMYILLERIRGD
jgi:hypothetical protein